MAGVCVFREGDGLEQETAQPYRGLHDEDLAKLLTVKRFSCSRFGLSFHETVLLFDWGFQPLILQVPAIRHNYSNDGHFAHCASLAAVITGRRDAPAGYAPVAPLTPAYQRMESGTLRQASLPSRWQIIRRAIRWRH